MLRAPYVPATVGKRLVAELDRTMTVEKAIVAGWTRIPGWETGDDLRDFARSLARKRRVRRRQRHVDDELPAVARHYRAFIDGGIRGP